MYRVSRRGLATMLLVSGRYACGAVHAPVPLALSVPVRSLNRSHPLTVFGLPDGGCPPRHLEPCMNWSAASASGRRGAL